MRTHFAGEINCDGKHGKLNVAQFGFVLGQFSLIKFNAFKFCVSVGNVCLFREN